MDSVPVAPTLGLTSAEAAARIRQFGENVIAGKRHLRPILAFLGKFKSPLLIILMVSSVISFFVGERTNSIILVAMVLVSVVLDFVNTYRSEKAVAELTSRVLTTTTVLRDGRPQEVSPRTLVPGDVVQLAAGSVVPADARVIEANDFFVNDSVLTGESVPAEKRAAPPGSAPAEFATDQPDAVPMGTSVVTGYATVRVVETGARTRFGVIAARLAGAEPPTDFEKTIREFSLFTMRLTFVLVAVVFLLNALLDRGWLASFLFAIAIAIGLTPELLPVIISVSLSRGAVRMSRSGVIVKRLPAIQNFGRMDVLCTDKTGTLTENHITVVRYVDTAGRENEGVLRAAYLNSVLHTRVTSPLDQAVREFRTLDLGGIRKVEEIPFDFERRRESIVVEEAGAARLVTSGAPESVFGICTKERTPDGATAFDAAGRSAAQRQFDALSAEGFKVLAVAERSVPSHAPSYEAEIERDMTLLGFIAFIDPPKASAGRAIRDLEQLGVEVKVVTGDSALLAERIAKEVDIPNKGIVVGDQLRGVSGAALQRLVEGTTIFARITPEQKEDIIKALMAAGHVVGYLGDGINDAPALRAADVGVSVSNAVDVAKDIADIILLKNSLRVLRDGVVEGRRTFQNALKYILMGLSSNFGNMFSMTAASGFLPFLPMLPTQVLLNNFLYDSSQVTLSTDAVDEDDVRRPTVWNLAFLRRFMLVFGPVSSIFDFITFGVLLWAFRLPEGGFQTGWFIESIATQVLVIYVIRTRRSFLKSRPGRIVVINTALIVTLAWVLPYLPFAQHWFRLVPLPLPVVLALAGIVIGYLLLAEFAKHLFYRSYRTTLRPVERPVKAV